jgi:hypothetical protein
MVTEITRSIHTCECSTCRLKPRRMIARHHRGINRLIAAADERLRRWFAGLLSWKLGRGGIQELVRITGLHRNTIARGQREVRSKRRFAAGRIRRLGAGRKRVEEQRPGP